jgi:hypothetical protein
MVLLSVFVHTFFPLLLRQTLFQFLFIYFAILDKLAGCSAMLRIFTSKNQKIKKLLCLNSYTHNRWSACKNFGGLGPPPPHWTETENKRSLS